MQRVVLHLDMDAFYAAVEARDHPELAGRPLIVGHRGRRGVVATCSYEARRFGVRSAMPSVTAERLCPDAVWLPGRMERYLEVSRRISRIFERFSPLVEPLSIDEAFLDLTGIARDLSGGAERARALKEAIRRSEGLTASVGVAPNKFLAKFASDLEKPDGLVVLTRDDLPLRLWPLPVIRLWGVGPRTAALLEQAGFPTIGSIAEAGSDRLSAVVGSGFAPQLQARARGEDDRPVIVERDARSISEERTWVEDLRDPDAIDRALLARAEGVARELRGAGLVARTVRLKARNGAYRTWTRARTLSEPTDLTETIVDAARLLLATLGAERSGWRLLGVGAAGLERSADRPPLLFDATDRTVARRLARATDVIRARFGEAAVTRARLAASSPGAEPAAVRHPTPR